MLALLGAVCSEALAQVTLRGFIADRCAAGWSKGRVKDSLVARFGRERATADPGGCVGEVVATHLPRPAG